MLSTTYLRNLRSIDNQHKIHVQAVRDKHDEQMLAIGEKGKPCPTLKALQNVEERRQEEQFTHNKKVKELEKTNADQETKHNRMVTQQDKVISCQDNQLRYQKLQLGEQKKEWKQEIEDMKEDVVELLIEQKKEVKEVKELKMELKQVKEMMHRLEEDNKKLEEENKVLLSQVEGMTVSDTAGDRKD